MPGTIKHEAPSTAQVIVKSRAAPYGAASPLRRSHKPAPDLAMLLLVVVVILTVVETLWGFGRLFGGVAQWLDEATVVVETSLRRLCGVRVYFPT
jgi:hypothetical protein